MPELFASDTKISVTAAHIRHGEPGSAVGCPVALALRTGGFPTAKVYTGLCVIDGRRWTNSPLVRDQINLFDTLEVMDPFVLVLGPDGWARSERP